MFFFLVILLSFAGDRCCKAKPGPHLSRVARQAPSNNGSPSQIQIISLLPADNVQSSASCFQLNNQIPPPDCVFVPNLVEGSTGRLVSCSMVCLGDTTQFAIAPLSQNVAGFLPAVAPYIISGQFQITDQSGGQAGSQSLEAFSGESYGVLRTATSTTAATVTATVTSATSTVTPGTDLGTISTSATSTTGVPTTTTLVPARDPVLTANKVQTCYIGRMNPPSGCTFNPDTCDVCCKNALDQKECQFSPDLKQIIDCLAAGLSPSDGCSFITSGEKGSKTCGIACRPFGA